MSDAPSPLEIYYASEHHRRNMQVARACGAQASVEQALERALTVKSIPLWLIAYLESAANRLPGLQTDLAAWRDLAPDAPETVRADLCDPMSDPRVKALLDALEPFAKEGRGILSRVDADWKIRAVDLGSHLRRVSLTAGNFQNAAAAIAAVRGVA